MRARIYTHPPTDELTVTVHSSVPLTDNHTSHMHVYIHTYVNTTDTYPPTDELMLSLSRLTALCLSRMVSAVAVRRVCSSTSGL